MLWNEANEFGKKYCAALGLSDLTRVGSSDWVVNRFLGALNEALAQSVKVTRTREPALLRVKFVLKQTLGDKPWFKPWFTQVLRM